MAKSGRRREWARATDDKDIFPAVADEDAETGDNDEDDAQTPPQVRRAT